MTLEQLAGQLLWCGWGGDPQADGPSYDAHARRLVEEIGVGGVVLFDRNLRAPEQIAELTETLRAHAAEPLLIGIDQEGGRVNRLPLPGLTFSGNMALGALNDLDCTRAVARAIGEQLAALGVDVDFAPSLDVNNNPRNPIIGVRSFGEEAEHVARHGIASVRGFLEAGILPVVKHFPGHGDTSADSHLELPVQPADRARLDAVELLPFRAAFRAGAPAVMTTHIRFPALDPDLPATLSRPILTGMLRQELGFDGLVVTDCLEMRGIADHWGPEEAAILALEAGADMLLVCHTLETQLRMRDAIVAAVRSGRLPEERLRDAHRRLDAARAQTAGVRDRRRRPECVGAQVYRELEDRVARETLHLCTGASVDALSPWDAAEPVIVSGAEAVTGLMARSLRDEGFIDVRACPWGDVSRSDLGSGSQLLWIALPDAPFPGGTPPTEVRELLAGHRRAVVVSAREPYLLEYYPEQMARLCAWASTAPQFRAVARFLAGKPLAPEVGGQESSR